MRLIRTDRIRPGDLLAGTHASGNYEGGPRRVAKVIHAPEHEKRRDGTKAFWIVWTDDTELVYYADTQVWLAQRP